jgi:hypothetical protein
VRLCPVGRALTQRGVLLSARGTPLFDQSLGPTQFLLGRGEGTGGRQGRSRRAFPGGGLGTGRHTVRAGQEISGLRPQHLVVREPGQQRAPAVLGVLQAGRGLGRGRLALPLPAQPRVLGP